MSMFKKATKEKARLRLALVGPSGSGKTYSALAIAKHLGKRIAVIDTERGSAAKYAGIAADFDVCELEHHAPSEYVKAIKGAEAEKYDVIVVDSLSHAWMGKGGALEQVDNAAKRSNGNSFTAWRDVTPQHNALVEALVGCKAHVIVTMRSKTEYVLEDGKNGKKTPRKVGMAPIQRDGLEYEFDVLGEMNLDNEMIVTKTRCPALAKGVFAEPGENVASKLVAWLSDGAESAPRAPAEPPPSGFVSDLATSLGKAIDQAGDLDTLETIGTQIKREAESGALTAAEVARLKVAYKATLDALKRAAELDRLAQEAADRDEAREAAADAEAS